MNSLYDELRAIGENITLHPRPRFRWDKAIIGTRDLIFPAKNQVNAWEGTTVVQELDEPHFFHFRPVVLENRLDKATIKNSFGNAASTYEREGLIQSRIARQLNDKIPSRLNKCIDNILEIGCGEGGNLLPFAELGCKVTGIDRAASRIHQAETFFTASGYKGEFTTTDFFNFSSASRYQLILIHDVIEHISNKEEFFRCLSPLLAKRGIIFWGFPSWQMPFGGHQQICHNRFVSSLPFIHLCPGILYRFLLRCFHETPSCIEELSDIKRCRMTIDTFEQLAEKYGYEITDRQLWFINPHYQQKFHLRPRKLYPVLAQLKYIRNYFSTSCFYITRHRELHD